MKRFLSVALLLFAAPTVGAAELPKPLFEGLVNPESVAIGPGGKMYVSVIGEFDKDGDGAVVVIENGKAVPIVTGLDDPKGIAFFQRWLFIADKTKVLRVDLFVKGGGRPKVDMFAPANAFPVEPKFLNDIAVDPESGTVFVSDSGDLKGAGGAVYSITPNGLVKTIVNEKNLPGLNTPNGLAMDGASHILLADFGSGILYRIKLADGSSEKLAEGMDGADGVTWDQYGRLYVSSWKTGKLYGIPRPGAKPVLVAEGFKSAADTCLDPTGKFILVPDMKAGTLTAIPAQIPGFEVNDSQFPMKTEIAFPDLKWAGWSGESETGKPQPLRPLVLTHANDGTNRVFVGTQHGVIHVFPNDQKATETKIFLDIQKKVQYDDRTNEEGFLGMTFHPKFKETGEVFVFYTPKAEKTSNVVTRFKLSKTDPTKLDPDSEEEIIRFKNRPYWNHDGGTICFGPDGYLYITHGDGGDANDRFDNGQKLSTWFGKILRIDIDAKADGKNYAIPKDNPFVGVKDAKPEIYAYGLRNVWRMSFDRKTGKLWAADVGQNLFEEINLIEKGGNYGWNRREGMHPFGAKGSGLKKGFIEPIWEYNHDVGKSITGGTVYRGKAIPELEGYYLHADYVTSKIWALKYDEKAGRVTENRWIKDPQKPVLSFGEDEPGELYFLTVSANGKGIYRFVK
jgi:glucose/arabinose dehydrogenase